MQALNPKIPEAASPEAQPAIRLVDVPQPSLLDVHSAGVLLTQPDSCGTLAAARELGKRGITACTIGPSRVSLASSSRFVAEHFRGPAEWDTVGYIDSLERLGRSRPGTVLYPASDNCSWLQSLHAARLQQHFRTYSPDVTTIERVLDKRRLYEACDAVGIETPVTHFAESLDEVAAVARQARFPMLLKQRTQILSQSRTKGVIVRESSQLMEAYQRFIERNAHAAQLRQRIPFASWPMMQEFHPQAYAGSYLISGFVDRGHREFVAQAAVKVLQYPRTLGIALCMEEAPLDTVLAERIRELCKLTGFFGVFQIEFLIDGARRLLIDFNPRYYHYMAFDIARGLTLPWLVQLAACGDRSTLSQEIARIRATGSDRGLAFTYRLQLAQMLRAQRLTRIMSGDEARHWRQWSRQRRTTMVDAVADPTDRWPEVFARTSSWWWHLRHPRAFIRQIALDR